MELQYYIQYILSWFYHNVIYTEATYAILKIGLIIGLVSLLVYRQYALFVLLCIVILSLEGYQWMKETNSDFSELQTKIAETVSGSGAAGAAGAAGSGVGLLDITTGVSISSREGFSLGMPKIVRGDDSGKDHRRSNKFIEEDSSDFTERYFKSKQCSIGSGIGGITMFGSNELIGSSRTATVNSIYDFEGKVRSIPNNDTDPNPNVVNQRKMKRYEYFRDCVLQPVSRSTKSGKDFRAIKKELYNKVNDHIINIQRCLSRFNTDILFNTISDISADKSKSVTIAGQYTLNNSGSGNVEYRSLIAGSNNSDKMNNLKPLDTKTEEYSKLLQFTSETYKTDIQAKELYLAVYGKVFRYGKRIDEILSMMLQQSKNDQSAMNTIRVSEPIIKELRMILGYLAIIQRTNDIIGFEEANGIYTKVEEISKSNTREIPAFNNVTVPATITDDVNNKILNILKLPHEDDSYNNTDEKRYLYGITYYFGGRPHGTPS